MVTTRNNLPPSPRVMGILNVTPDSFWDGGRFTGREAALAQARRMAKEGADIIDVGGESTRPGAAWVSEQEELDRVIPVIRAIRGELPIRLSIDTSRPRVMREAVAAGADIINDVRALQIEGALETASELVHGFGVRVCLMHMQGDPATMQTAPVYEDVVETVRGFLLARIAACEARGIPRARLWVDPGFGFGKTLDHNLALLAGLDRLVALGPPVLVGLSRKSLFGALLDKPVEERLAGSIAGALAAVTRGAAVVRVHDVGATVDALTVWRAVSERGA